MSRVVLVNNSVNSTQVKTVIKRDNSSQQYDPNKIIHYLEVVSKDLTNIDVHNIFRCIELQLTDKIRTSQILQIMITVCSNLICEDMPDFQYVTSRLMINVMRREVWNSFEPTDTFYDRVISRIHANIYDDIILQRYSQQEFDELECIIDYDKDFIITYSGVRQFYDKYLIKNRVTNELQELPQEANMLICMYMFMNESSQNPQINCQTTSTNNSQTNSQTNSDVKHECEVFSHSQVSPQQLFVKQSSLRESCVSSTNSQTNSRMNHIKTMYHYLSNLVISLPTPIYAGVRGKLRSFSSCCVIDCGDTTNSILSTNYIIGKAITKRFGIGVNVNKIRGLGASVSNGSVIHTGIVPFLKMFEASTRGFVQNGIRGGQATISFPFWNWEVMTLLELKNNKGVQENRIRTMDYSIGLNKLFIVRYAKGEDITLFSAEDVPLLTNNYTYTYEQFKSIYEMYEHSPLIQRRQKVSSIDLMKKIAKERFETGRIYIYFMDNMNNYGVFHESIYSSNLCQEIALPTSPVDMTDNSGLISVCILSCINVGRINNWDELREICDIIVRFLNHMIDYQEYVCPQIEKSAVEYRPLGIGISDLFHLLAKKKLKYDTIECRDYVHELAERFQYYLLESSCELAKQYGPCKAFNQSKYADLILPIDNYKPIIDTLTSSVNYKCDWELLRQNIKLYGLRNTCLSAIPPTASSCSISNSTPGIDPPRTTVISKMSKYGLFKQLIPDYTTCKSYYTLQKHIKNEPYFKLIGVIQKFIDQGISTNSFYMSDDEVSFGDIINEIVWAFKYGLKSLYYLNNNKGVDNDINLAMSTSGIRSNSSKTVSPSVESFGESDDCAGGACKL